MEQGEVNVILADPSQRTKTEVAKQTSTIYALKDETTKYSRGLDVRKFAMQFPKSAGFELRHCLAPLLLSV